MKIAFIGDVHLANHRYQGGELKAGLNARFRTTLRAVEEALGWAESQGCTDVVILGDVFDTPKPLPQQLAALRVVLASFSGAVHVLVGNHDRVSSEEGDHGLGPLSLDGVFVYDKPSFIGDSTVQVLLCPFNDRPVKEWLPSLLKDTKWGYFNGQAQRLVCGHFGLWDRQHAASQPWLTNANDAIDVETVVPMLAAHQVKHLYVGNYHTHFRWEKDGVTLHQVGALQPTGFDNPGFAYGVVETWPNDAHTVVTGPRFVVVGSGAELAKASTRADEEGCWIHADWRVAPEAYAETVEAVAMLQEGEHPIDGGPILRGTVEVHVDRKYSKLRAAQAAGAARSSDTLIEAVHAFVEKHPMAPHVSRENVLEHVRRFLGC